MQTYICAGCEYRTTDLSECHDKETNIHYCPQCHERKYHFQARHDLEIEARQNDWRFIGNVNGAEWNCSACRAIHGKPNIDFATLPIPDGWTDETKRHCSRREDGIAASRRGRICRASVGSLSVEDVYAFCGVIAKNHERVFHTTGDDWHVLTAQVDTEYQRIESAYETEISELIGDLQEVAKANGYKPGYIWYRVKDKYNADIANEFSRKRRQTCLSSAPFRPRAN